MSKQINIRPGLQTLSLVSLLTACSGGEVDLGGSTIAQNVERGSRCRESTIVDESVRIASQSELDALLGCEEIRGDLLIEVFDGTDLRSLGSLRSIEGDFVLGIFPEIADDDYDGWGEAVERRSLIVEAGWLASLDGLESLERVGSLALNDVAASDLHALGSLRLLSGGRNILSLNNTRNLINLTGLENLVGVRWLDVAGATALESMAGLPVGTSMDRLYVLSSPRLADMDAFASVESIDSLLYLEDTGLRNLDAFSNLRSTFGGLAINQNAELTNVDALAALTSSEWLVFERNPKLESLPSFPDLQLIDYFKAKGNAELRSISLDVPQHLSLNIVQDADVELSSGVIEVGDNPKLESLTFEAGFTAAQVLAIYRNDALASIDLGSLQRLDRLSINGNASLTEVNLGALQTVDSLTVLANPLLSTAGLQTVRTFESEFAQNADDPAP